MCTDDIYLRTERYENPYLWFVVFFSSSFHFQDKKEKELDGAGKRRKTSQSEDVSITVRKVSGRKTYGRFLVPTSVLSFSISRKDLYKVF